MTDKDLSDFIEHGENGFQEFAIAFGYAWATMAIQIAKELRTRRAQPEPVSWAVQEGANLHDVFLFKDEADEMCHLKGTHAKAVPLYTAPQKKEWVGLTNDEQLEAIWESGKDGLTGDRYDVALAIEAKLKEKNYES